jgi:hypothetical protein
MGNVTTREVTWRFLLNQKAFVKGFADKRKGRPFDYDYVDRVTARREGRKTCFFGYERGRQLATIYEGKLKEGRTVLSAAIYAVASAMADKAIR